LIHLNVDHANEFAMLGKSPSKVPVATGRRARSSHVLPSHRHIHIIPCQVIPFLFAAALLFGLALLMLAIRAHA
jgi:hypothetical protein